MLIIGYKQTDNERPFHLLQLYLAFLEGYFALTVIARFGSFDLRRSLTGFNHPLRQEAACLFPPTASKHRFHA